MTDATAGGPTLPIDPRIRARRIAVLRDEGRRRLRRLAALGALVGALALAGLATRTPLLDVDRIQVEGAQRTSVDAVLAATGVRPGDPLTDVDLGRARAALETLPWVARAEVTRAWSGTIRVRLTERVAVATVAAGDRGWALLDEAGRVLELAPAPLAGAVPIEGVDAAVLEPGGHLDPSAAGALAVATAMTADLAARVAAVALVDGAVELRLADQGVARLGPPTHVGAKLTAVWAVLTQADTGCLAVLDVRVPATPVLTRNPACG